MKKKIIIAVVVLALLIGAYFAYTRYKNNPQRKFDDAMKELSKLASGDAVFKALSASKLITDAQRAQANEAADNTGLENDSKEYTALALKYAQAIISGTPHAEAIKLIKK